MEKFAVIVAGGSGSRMGSDTPKQFMLLKGKPVVCHTLEAFLEAYKDIEIVLVLPAGYMKEGEEIINASFNTGRIHIVAGGNTRFQSVKNGLAKVSRDAIVFVHDAVRCLVTAALIRRCCQQATEKGSAVPAVVSKDSIRMLSDDGSRPIDRNKIMLVQTPQTFQSNLLITAFAHAAYEKNFTDEATVVESGGVKVHLIEGEETNIKITRPVDLLIAEQYLDMKG